MYLIHANILRTPLCMFHQNFLCRFFAPASTSEPPTGPNIEIHQVCSYTFLFVLFMRSFCAHHFVSMKNFFLNHFRTLVAFVSFNNEFHQLWFSYLYSPRLCEHFSHPTLYVWTKFVTSFFCASPNFSGPHRSQYWVSSCVPICFFVCPIETYINNGWFFL
jgi:hypothetical protein